MVCRQSLGNHQCRGTLIDSGPAPGNIIDIMRPRPAIPVRRLNPKLDEPPFWLFRLETWLMLASLCLFFQIFPSVFLGLLYIVDVRNWTWGVWVGVEVAIVATLLVLWGWQKSD